MEFLNPQNLWLLAVILLFMRVRKDLLLMAAMVCAVIALSRPVIQEAEVERRFSGSDVILAIDLSYSMRAKDIAPSRLSASKALLDAVIENDKVDRFGVIGFTTNAIILSPLTQDGALLKNLVGRIDENSIITKGTTILPVLELARKMSYAKQCVVVLLTDGGEKQDFTQEIRYAKKHHIVVNIVMMATHFGASIADDDGKLLRDKEGNIVVSSRNDAIATLAKSSGGVVIDDNLGTLLDQLRSLRTDDHERMQKAQSYLELFYFFGVLALLFFIMAVTSLRSRLLKLLVAVGLSSSANAAFLDGYYIEAANSAYKNDEFKKAAHYYAEVGSTKAQYNAATSYYRADEYEKALTLFKQIKSADPLFKSKVYYNKALCYVKMRHYEEAKQALLKSLVLHYDKDADENLQRLYALKESPDVALQKQKNATDAKTANQKKKKKKSAGGSNMQASSAQSGASKGGDETKLEQQRFDTDKNSKRVGLSSKQYELINKGSVNEDQPW